MSTPILSLPHFTLHATDDKTITEADLKGRYTVLYFYPKDSTPGCTLEGRAFTTLYPQFKALGAEIFGVSKDSVQSHNKFKCNQNFAFPLLADTDQILCQHFGVLKEKSMFGKKYWGIERSTFLLDPAGQVIMEWRKVSVLKHAEKVLKALQTYLAQHNPS